MTSEQNLVHMLSSTCGFKPAPCASHRSRNDCTPLAVVERRPGLLYLPEVPSVFLNSDHLLYVSPSDMNAASDMETQGRFGALCTHETQGPFGERKFDRTIVSFAYLLREFTETEAKAKAREYLDALPSDQKFHHVSVLPWRHPAMEALNVKDDFVSLRKTDSSGTGLPPLWPHNCPPPFPRNTSPVKVGII